ASISVPGSSITGSYTISWGASTGTVTAYELYQATNASFSGQTRVYSGTGTSTALSGRGNGVYYYRVRACSTSAACSGYRTGANAVTVTRPPGAPASISVPAGSISGSYTISWGTSTGNVTAYQLYEATNSSFTGAVLAYSGTGTSRAISGKGNGTYYYRVRACNTTAACSAYRTGANATSVTLPPSVPGAASVLSVYNNTGSYTISWGASSGNVTAYELLENVLYGSETLLYSGTAISTSVSGRTDGTRSYRLRACNTSAACSGYTATQGNGAVVVVDTVAPTPPTSLNMTGPGYTLYWSNETSGVGSWNVYRNGSYIGTSSQPRPNFQDPAPPANVTLNYNVRSVDHAGNESGNSPTYSMYIDTVPPTTPGNLRVTGVTTGSVSLAWDASSDSNGISYYNIGRSPGNSMMATEWGLTHTDGSVAANTTYTYYVTAIDNHGTPSAPASVTVTTPSGAPGVPVISGSARVRDTDGSFTISWSDTGAAYYLLREGGGEYRHDAPSRSRSFNYGNGTYYYNVRACTAGGVCSGYSATKVIEVCIGACN
ncbi:MAG: fibronectin type III domain-containing protein, partial [Longimicrobiales bacterium]